MRYDFDAIGHGMPALLQTAGHGRRGLALFLIGFGIKAGMWPFGQLWLPAAHPAAPSPVSALLSGVMIKTGVYGLMRSFLWLVPAEALDAYPSEVWGLVIAALGDRHALHRHHARRWGRISPSASSPSAASARSATSSSPSAPASP